MNSKEVRRHFDEMAKDFEKIRGKIIPEYRFLERLVFHCLPFRPSGKLDILELGTGPGSLAVQLLRYFPRATYTGVDYSDKMIEIAARRLGKFEQRIKLLKVDLNREKVEGSYDAIVSLFTLHHVNDKKSLFKRLYSLLKPGGCLFYADVVMSTNKRLEKRFVENWQDFMRKAGLPGEKIKGIIADHRKYDRAETVEAQLLYLKSAGFASRDIVWSREKNAVFFALKGR